MLSVVENRMCLLINSWLNLFPLLFLVEVEMVEAETRQSGKKMGFVLSISVGKREWCYGGARGEGTP